MNDVARSDALEDDTSVVNKRVKSPPGTSEEILDVAEQLFGLHGLDGVSLRAIGAAAGSSNNYAVQYHFGDKAQLVRAIFERRLPALEVQRARLLSAVTRDGKGGDPRALLEVVLRPIAAERDRDGRCSYAAFLVGLDHFEGDHSARMEVADMAPLTHHVVGLLAGALPQIPEALFPDRSLAAWTVFLAALVRWDRRKADGQAVLPRDVMIADALDSAFGALTAPVSQEVANGLT